ncbi:hypothetical protein AVEN_249115-1 [Araneus ventricosus]|uniref:Uncharacterized protein n=1 Tax=Araneus ventricosus TaxID=182803 RepID=A0A4Y2WKI1_ARAVE|nr:hypothetical protein AVEN_249115-1 [Araneus ventricosus]
MEPDTESKFQRFNELQLEVIDHIRYLNVLDRKYGGRPISAPIQADKDVASRTLKRITGEWHDIWLHLPDSIIQRFPTHGQRPICGLWIAY